MSDRFSQILVGFSFSVNQRSYRSIPCPPSFVICHLSLVTRHLSLVTRHSSLVTRHVDYLEQRYR